MHATTVAVDLAKSVFQIAVADDKWKLVEQHRLTRLQFQRWFDEALKAEVPEANAMTLATVSRDGWIVFTSTRDGDLELYKVRLDGSGLTRLVQGDEPPINLLPFL